MVSPPTDCCNRPLVLISGIAAAQSYDVILPELSPALAALLRTSGVISGRAEISKKCQIHHCNNSNIVPCYSSPEYIMVRDIVTARLLSTTEISNI